MSRYKELKYEGQTYNKTFEINEILLHHRMDWFLEAEVEHTRLEIINETLVWNAGLWYNGNWKYGVFRAGEWRYGVWNGGVWYNGLWRNGIFNSGIIFNGKFLNGKIEGGDIRGGEFINVSIKQPNVKIGADVKIFKKESILTYSDFIKNI